jgi:hypothetical protein
MIISRIVCRFFVKAICLAIVAPIFPDFLLADTIVLKRGKRLEEYSGTIKSANQEAVVLDLECRGRLKEFHWSQQLFAIQLNSKCKPSQDIGAGGFERDCRKRFLLIDSHYVAENYLNNFKYYSHILEADGRKVLDFERMAFFSEKGSEIKIPKGETDFRVIIQKNCADRG